MLVPRHFNVVHLFAAQHGTLMAGNDTWRVKDNATRAMWGRRGALAACSHRPQRVAARYRGPRSLQPARLTNKRSGVLQGTMGHLLHEGQWFESERPLLLCLPQHVRPKQVYNPPPLVRARERHATSAHTTYMRAQAAKGRVVHLRSKLNADQCHRRTDYSRPRANARARADGPALGTRRGPMSRTGKKAQS